MVVRFINPTAKGKLVIVESCFLSLGNIVIVHTQMLPVLEALFDFDDLQLYCHSAKEIGKCLRDWLDGSCSDCLDAMQIPCGVSSGAV